jgi:hypothetical protein
VEDGAPQKHATIFNGPATASESHKQLLYTRHTVGGWRLTVGGWRLAVHSSRSTVDGWQLTMTVAGGKSDLSWFKSDISWFKSDCTDQTGAPRSRVLWREPSGSS